MALKFFTQKDIDSIDARDISDEFINYFDGLSNERKAEIIESRPDLAPGLGYYASNEVHENNVQEIDINIYEGKNLKEMIKSEVDPFEALSFRDENEVCKIHKKHFEVVDIRYKRGRGTFGLQPRYCEECGRFYIKESMIDYVTNELSKRDVKVKIYSLEESDEYIKRNMPEIELKEGEKIYIPEVWVEENPICPIHRKKYEANPCVIKYKDREIKFSGWFCEKCDKIILRKTKALDLEDECAMRGIPVPEIEILTARIQKKKLPLKKIKPEYYINDGKIQKFDYENTGDCYEILEQDTVVISDSIYCKHIDHTTEEVITLFWVNMRRKGRKAFLALMGYCSQCQKYYMSEEDYKAIYSLGRPEFQIINDVEEAEYQITSGEIFEFERKHLNKLEIELNKEVDLIQKNPDYVSQFEKGDDYDDISALQWNKKKSADKYEPIIDKLSSYMPKPYTYRVDIIFNGVSETYYIGANDIELGKNLRVISYNSDFGKKLVNYRTLNVIKDGKQYDVKLSRQFDIDRAQLFGYVNLRTDEDVIFRAGVTDPFLIKVLNLRKKQHNLVDIFISIQENQNTIVDVKMDQNMIIQGCAGSGKTMVLLHRLSSLKYNHPEFDFAKALILTPNDQFNLHINGLAEGLQIGNVERVSIEQYYLNILKQYSEEFYPKNRLSSEIFVNQKYVDYVYSNDFYNQFEIKYADVISERNELIELLKGVTKAIGEKYSEINLENDSEVIPVLKRRVTHIKAKITINKKALTETEQGFWLVEHRKEALNQLIPQTKENLTSIIPDILPRVNNKIIEYIADIQKNINEQEEAINNINAEITKVERQLLPFGKKNRLEELKKEYNKAFRKMNNEQTRLEDARKVFDFNTEGKSDAEIISWIRRVSMYESSVREEIKLYDNVLSELNKLLDEQANIEEKIIAAAEKYKIAQDALFPFEVTKSVDYLKTKCEEYSALGTYKIVFSRAIESFVKENECKITSGTRRYDLYMQLWFCMKFYKNSSGSHTFICVDEGQDMAFNEYKLIYELNHKNVIFNIYGDTNQLLKPGRGINNWAKLKKEYHMEVYFLNENYRNTNQITRFCNDSFGMKVIQTGVDGAAVREIPRRDLEKELSALSVNNERIAILVPRKVRKTDYIDKAILPSNIVSLIGNEIDNGKISFMYVDEVKGIEFDKVFVISNKMSKNEKYIAYTRALSELIIVVDENIVEDSELAMEDE